LIFYDPEKKIKQGKEKKAKDKRKKKSMIQK